MNTITRGRGKRDHAAIQTAEVPFKMNAEGELELTAELAEALRHRELVWARIPPRSRKAMLPFLTVQETLALDTAVAPGQEKERDHLEEAYRGLRSGGFDEYVFSDKNRFEGIRWARKRGIDLRHLKLEYKGAGSFGELSDGGHGHVLC